MIAKLEFVYFERNFCMERNMSLVYTEYSIGKFEKLVTRLAPFQTIFNSFFKQENAVRFYSGLRNKWKKQSPPVLWKKFANLDASEPKYVFWEFNHTSRMKSWTSTLEQKSKVFLERKYARTSFIGNPIGLFKVSW